MIRIGFPATASRPHRRSIVPPLFLCGFSLPHNTRTCETWDVVWQTAVVRQGRWLTRCVFTAGSY